MGRKQTIKTAVDALMTIALLMLMAYELIGQTTHEITGTVMMLLLRNLSRPRKGDKNDSCKTASCRYGNGHAAAFLCRL